MASDETDHDDRGTRRSACSACEIDALTMAQVLDRWTPPSPHVVGCWSAWSTRPRW